MVNQVCRVNINASCQRGPDTLPFTGRKDSAVATLSVKAALRSFSIRTLVACSADQKELVEEVIAGGHSSFSSMNYLLGGNASRGNHFGVRRVTLEPPNGNS